MNQTMNKPLRLCIAAAVAALPWVVLAQTAPAEPAAPASDPEADQGRPFRIGNIYLRPSLTVRWGYDDNITQAPGTAAQPKVASGTWNFTPGLTGDIEYKGDRYSLDYQGNITQYSDSTQDNMANHALFVRGNNTLTTRNAIRWEAGLQDAYDPRGSTEWEQSSGLDSSEPSHHRTYRYGGTYSYGAPGAKGRIELEAFQTDKTYLNNRAVTTTADVGSTDLAGRFFWRVMPKTSAVLEVRQTASDYTASNALLDSRGTQLMVGVNWSATAATSGSLRVGQTTRNFDDPLRASFRGLGWQASVNWKPWTYSVFDFSTARDVSDTANDQAAVVGSYIVSTSYAVSWHHDWLSYLHSQVKWSYQEMDYEGIDRSDQNQSLMLGAYYDFRRWMNLGFEVTQSTRRSSMENMDYDRWQTMAVLQAKF